MLKTRSELFINLGENTSYLGTSASDKKKWILDSCPATQKQGTLEMYFQDKKQISWGCSTLRKEYRCRILSIEIRYRNLHKIINKFLV